MTQDDNFEFELSILRRHYNFQKQMEILEKNKKLA